MTESHENLQLGPHSALIIVDMLNDFCAPSGLMPVPRAENLYHTLNALTRQARDVGSPVIWACDHHYPGDKEFDIRPRHCMAGSWGAEIVPDLHQSETDRYVLKRRFSAFFATDLDLLLRETLVHTVIVVGVMTNICVRATVHDAFFHAYQVIVPSDCVATLNDREQRSTLDDISQCFGRVVTSQQLTESGVA